jgi:ABC-type nickel/cobalt efflux system permease component RcnA
VAVEALLWLYLGAVGLGLLHGLEPGHGWPVAAAWALARPARWRAGVLAATVIGLGPTRRHSRSSPGALAAAIVWG